MSGRKYMPGVPIPASDDADIIGYDRRIAEATFRGETAFADQLRQQRNHAIAKRQAEVAATPQLFAGSALRPYGAETQGDAFRSYERDVALPDLLGRARSMRDELSVLNRGLQAAPETRVPEPIGPTLPMMPSPTLQALPPTFAPPAAQAMTPEIMNSIIDDGMRTGQLPPGLTPEQMDTITKELERRQGLAQQMGPEMMLEPGMRRSIQERTAATYQQPAFAQAPLTMLPPAGGGVTPRQMETARGVIAGGPTEPVAGAGEYTRVPMSPTEKLEAAKLEEDKKKTAIQQLMAYDPPPGTTEDTAVREQIRRVVEAMAKPDIEFGGTVDDEEYRMAQSLYAQVKGMFEGAKSPSQKDRVRSAFITAGFAAKINEALQDLSDTSDRGRKVQAWFKGILEELHGAGAGVGALAVGGAMPPGRPPPEPPRGVITPSGSGLNWRY